MVDISNLKIEFEDDQAVGQLEQLVSIMPIYSFKLFPQVIKEAFTKEDSSIYDYYPEDFYVDLEQKDAAWKGEVLLPFFKIERIREIL
jgi:5'-3' exonuclease